MQLDKAQPVERVVWLAPRGVGGQGASTERGRLGDEGRVLEVRRGGQDGLGVVLCESLGGA